MKRDYGRPHLTDMRLWLSILLLCAGIQAQPTPSAIDIVRKSVDRDWTDFAQRKNYTYQRTVDVRRYTKDRSLAHRERETHEMMILGGRPYERLIARDGKPISAKDAAKEQAKMDRELAQRQSESPAERARWEKQRAEDREFIREIPDAFQFRLAGTDTVSGQPAWVVEAEPRVDFHPKRSQAKMFQKIRAKIWIEQATYHWVKMDADVLDTLTFGLGLVRIARGATVHFEQTRVNDEIWLPSAALVRADARLALLKKLRAEFDIRYCDYKKFQSESRMEEIREQ